MDSAMKKEYILENLSCPVCAGKMEAKIRKLKGVAEAVVDFPSRKLSMEILSGDLLPDIFAKTYKIVKSIEPDVVISEATLGKRLDSASASDWKERMLRGGIILGAVIFLAGVAFKFSPRAELALFLASYLLIGGEVVWSALKNIARGQVFDENFLMSAASIGAFAIGEYPEGAAVMLFYQVGEAFQKMAVDRSRKSISSLMDIRPDFANLKTDDGARRVSPDDVRVGDLILVKPGEKVPLDGVVTEGRSTLDTSALTGESMPRGVEPGSDVLSGSINKNGLLVVEVTRGFGESTASKILDLIQSAGARKSPMENFITKFARYYTPAVVFAALALAVVPPLVMPGTDFTVWINRALVFLVVSCPCALVISIPLGFFGGIGGASRGGILIKGANYLEALNDVDTVVFDKTGTLTKGVFKVSRVEPANGWKSDDLLSVAAHAESNSNHPIAASILKAYGKAVDSASMKDYEEAAGQGISVSVGERRVLAGSARFLASGGVACPDVEETGTGVFIACDGIFAGYIVIADEIKADSKQAIVDLKNAGVRRVVMLTGDNKAIGESLAREVGVDAVITELLPHQKVEQLELIANEKTTKGRVVFVGDGINDAPALARSDVGIAMGGVGSDAAIEAADVVLMTDEPSKIASAIRIAKRTRNIVWQNIVFALGVKAVILVMGALGIATMWEAVFGDVGVAIIAILNATRAISSEPARNELCESLTQRTK